MSTVNANKSIYASTALAASRVALMVPLAAITIATGINVGGGGEQRQAMSIVGAVMSLVIIALAATELGLSRVTLSTTIVDPLSLAAEPTSIRVPYYLSNSATIAAGVLSLIVCAGNASPMGYAYGVQYMYMSWIAVLLYVTAGITGSMELGLLAPLVQAAMASQQQS